MVTLLVSYNEPSSLEKSWLSISGKHEETVEKPVSSSKLCDSDDQLSCLHGDKRWITLNCFSGTFYLSQISMIQTTSVLNSKISSVCALH